MLLCIKQLSYSFWLYLLCHLDWNWLFSRWGMFLTYSIYTFTGKLWLSITMLCPVGTSRRTGRAMWRPGLTRQPAEQEDVSVNRSPIFREHYKKKTRGQQERMQKCWPILLVLRFGWVIVTNIHPTINCQNIKSSSLTSLFSKTKEGCEDFPTAYSTGPIRPVVHGQTLKYNMKLRAGRGFSLEELQVSCFHYYLEIDTIYVSGSLYISWGRIWWLVSLLNLNYLQLIFLYPPSVLRGSGSGYS